MSYSEAISRIKKAQKNNSKILDLSGLSLNKIPNEIFELQNLTRLDINYNQISDITPLAQLQNLTKLDIGNNQIIDTTPLAQLQNLTRLNISYN